jgi:hypothetical protein
MDAFDVDDITDVNHSEAAVEVCFKDGTARLFTGAELPEALALLNHWTPPTA